MKATGAVCRNNPHVTWGLFFGLLAFVLCACYVRVDLSKKIPDDNNSYTLFIRKSWENGAYAVITGNEAVRRVAEQLELKASFGIGNGPGSYYCDNVKYPDGLIIARNDVYYNGQCLNAIDYLNIDSLGLAFNHTGHFERLNRKELRALAARLKKEGTPYFLEDDDTTYFGKHIYVFNVDYAKRAGNYRSRTGERIEKELAKSTTYKDYQMTYRVTSDTTLQFYFDDNDSTARLDSNLELYRTNSYRYEGYTANKFEIHYFTR